MLENNFFVSNRAAFDKEFEGLPSTRSVGDLPPELHCPLCKEVMKDAVLTSKCCFMSFCDKCEFYSYLFHASSGSFSLPMVLFRHVESYFNKTLLRYKGPHYLKVNVCMWGNKHTRR